MKLIVKSWFNECVRKYKGFYTLILVILPIFIGLITFISKIPYAKNGIFFTFIKTFGIAFLLSFLIFFIFSIFVYILKLIFGDNK